MAGCLFDLGLDLFGTSLQGLVVETSVDDGRGILVYGNPFGGTQVLQEYCL